ncbi:hypothetical protein BACCAP_00542 [Pseudoflavonifractor capillosus ATCC 29799]|uniref:Uncharacterized protein n=1 Tax=Pseudoflavonifractor capillosus ATCC 29799 TaxID=411467 RepID=A6NQS1_9FIRM|nr:hypothetical protein BACCAP_00542 [Pseudoflavonifractor capillosus ATCC 29799]
MQKKYIVPSFFHVFPSVFGLSFLFLQSTIKLIAKSDCSLYNIL